MNLDRRNLFLGGVGGAGLAMLASNRAAWAEDAQAPPIVSARSFGAVGDGIADDTEPLERTFAAALSGPEAVVALIEPGRYRITRPIRVRATSNQTRRAGIRAHGARIISAIGDGEPVIEIESRATVRYFLIDGLEIVGSGDDGHGLAVHCETRGTYLYNFCLRDVIVESCGGDGLRMVGNLFEGQIFNSYFRDNGRNGATFAHGDEDTVLSAVHVFGCVFGGNGRHGAELTDGATDLSFYGCYFLLNQYFGFSADTGCTLLSHCGFENNHMQAEDFAHGEAGARMMLSGTLVGCFAYSIYNQTHLLRTYVTNKLVMVGCTADGGGQAEDARLARIEGGSRANAIVIGCWGRIDRGGDMPVTLVGSGGTGARFGGEWDSTNLAWLGDHSLWVDGKGRLRIKKGKPSSDDDGAVVGT